MGGEGGSPGPSPEVAGPTVEAPAVSEATASPDIDNLDVLEKEVKDLEEAEREKEKPVENPAEEPTIQADSVGEEKSNHAQEAQDNATTGAEQTTAPETETQTPLEAPKVPAKLASDPEYVRLVGENYVKAKQQGGEINRAKIDQITNSSLSEYYNNKAKAELEKGLSPKVKDGKLYEAKMGEAVNGAIARGEALDPKKLSQEALAKYQQEEDLQTEKAAEPQAEQKTTDQKLEDVAQRLGALLENNGEKLESATVNVPAKDLASLLKALAEAKEPNPKKKETKLMLLLKLLGLLTITAVTETGKQIVPPMGGQR